MRTFHLALAIAGVLAAIGSATVGARQMGQTDKMDKMEKMNDLRPFTSEAFKSAMAEGKTTLLFFHAAWCPVCRAQEPKVMAHLNGEHRDVVAFKVDYDSNMPLRQELKVDKQSTLILYQGMKEIARLSYKSDDQSIAQFFGHANMAMSGAR